MQCSDCEKDSKINWLVDGKKVPLCGDHFEKRYIEKYGDYRKDPSYKSPTNQKI